MVENYHVTLLTVLPRNSVRSCFIIQCYFRRKCHLTLCLLDSTPRVPVRSFLIDPVLLQEET